MADVTTTPETDTTNPDATDVDAAADPAAAGGDAAKPKGRMMTQEDIDRVVASRVTRERAKYADYDDLKARAAKLSEIEEQGKSETEKLRGAAQRAQAERDQALDRAKNTLIRSAIVAEAAKMGAIDPQAVAALLPRDMLVVNGDDVEGVTEAVRVLLKEKPYLKSSGARVAGTEITGGAGGPVVFTRAQLRDTKFFRDNQKAIEQAQREGRIKD